MGIKEWCLKDVGMNWCMNGDILCIELIMGIILRLFIISMG